MTHAAEGSGETFADRFAEAEKSPVYWKEKFELANAALASERAIIEDAKRRADCGPNCTLASAIEGNKLALEQMGKELASERERTEKLILDRTDDLEETARIRGAESDRLREQVAALQADKKRLDFMDSTYIGKTGFREAIDAAMKGTETPPTRELPPEETGTPCSHDFGPIIFSGDPDEQKAYYKCRKCGHINFA